MKSTVSIWLLVGAVLGGTAVPLHGASSSYYTLRPEDAKAVYLMQNDPSVHGDGVSDDSDVIQQAINKVQETTGQGILFIPEGRYRLGKTLFVWPGIRLIGYCAQRPVFELGKNTPGYQEGMAYMVMFTGGRPPAEHCRGALRGLWWESFRRTTKFQMPIRARSTRP